jgi:hypothetical protein
MRVEKRTDFLFLVFLAAALIVSAPVVSYAQLAVKMAIEEIEKRIVEEIGKSPIPETDKAGIRKNLLGTVKQKTEKIYRASNKSLDRSELVSEVMKEVQPQIDELVALALESAKNKQDDTVSSPLAPLPPAPPPVMDSRAAAVFVAGGGDVSEETKTSVGAGILNALTDGKRYVAAGNGENFLAEINVLRVAELDGAVYDDRISEIAKAFGIGSVCVVEVTPTFDAFHVLARMLDARTAEAVSVGSAFSPLKSGDDIVVAANVLVRKMSGETVVPESEAKPMHKSGFQPGADTVSDRGKVDTVAPPPDTSNPVADKMSDRGEVDTMTRPSDTSNPVEIYERAPMTGFSLGYGLSRDAESNSGFLQIGVVHSRPISEMFAYSIEGNLGVGTSDYRYRYYDGSDYGYADSSMFFLGVSVPVTVLFQWWCFSIEAGAHVDALFGDGVTLFNGGGVAGIGIEVDKKRARRYFYRYNGGFNYGTHVIGMWWLF